MRRLLIAMMVVGTLACGNDDDGADPADDVSLADDAVGTADATTPTDVTPQPPAGKDCGTCPANRAQCDQVLGVCAACVLPGHCAGMGQRCIQGACINRIPCADDDGCKVVGGVCHKGACAGCTKDKQCAAGKMCRSNHCVHPPVVCTEDTQCGDWTCAKDLGQCVQCQGHKGCAANQHCLAGYCVSDVCKASSATCKPGPTNVRLVCSEQGDHIAEVKCGTEEHVCVDGKCVTGVCQPGITTCIGLQRAICSANGQFLVAVQDCAAKGATCSEGKCVSSVCDPGVSTCMDGQVATCNETGSAWSKKPCFGGTTCVDGTCTNTVCTIGELSCSGDHLVECLGGIKTSSVTDCAVQKQVCEGGQCVTPFCSPGGKQCKGNAVQTCNNKGTLWTTTQNCGGSTPFCSENMCANEICSPGQTKCGGDSILTCAAGNLSWAAKPCPAGQICGVGPKCVTPICKLPGTPAEPIQKIASLKTATINNSCDLNGDGKNDNSLASVSGLLGDLDGELAKGIASGQLLLLLQPTGWNATGKVFTVGIHTGTLDAASKSCNLISSSANCGYKVSAKGVNTAAQTKGTCPASNALDQSKNTNGTLLAKGSKSTVTLPLAIMNVPIPLPMKKLQVQASVSDATAWKTTSGGKLCGAVKATDLMNAIDGIPEAVFQQLGLTKPLVKSLLGTVLAKDIDSDGDGVKDAHSAAFTMTTVPGKITGLGI